MKVFSIEESLRFGWRTMRSHSAVVFQVVLTLLALQVTEAIVHEVLKGTALGFMASLVLTAAGVVLGVGATRMALRLAQSHPVRYADIVPPVRLLWPFIAASLLAGLAVVGGLILLVLPGIWVAIRLSMTRFEIIEGARIQESLKKSWELTRGHTWQLALFFVTLLLLNIIGALVFMVGLLVSMPVSALAHAHVYQKLKAARHHSH